MHYLNEMATTPEDKRTLYKFMLTFQGRNISANLWFLLSKLRMNVNKTLKTSKLNSYHFTRKIYKTINYTSSYITLL